MKPIDMLQCKDCKEALVEFTAKTVMTEETEKILGQFAVFMELRRLSKKTDVLHLPSGPIYRDHTQLTDKWKPVTEVTC